LKNPRGPFPPWGPGQTPGFWDRWGEPRATGPLFLRRKKRNFKTAAETPEGFRNLWKWKSHRSAAAKKLRMPPRPEAANSGLGPMPFFLGHLLWPIQSQRTPRKRQKSKIELDRENGRRKMGKRPDARDPNPLPRRRGPTIKKSLGSATKRQQKERKKAGCPLKWRKARTNAKMTNLPLESPHFFRRGPGDRRV